MKLQRLSPMDSKRTIVPTPESFVQLPYEITGSGNNRIFNYCVEKLM